MGASTAPSMPNEAWRSPLRVGGPAPFAVEVGQPRLRQGGRSATLPVDALDVLAGLLHREDALVDVVERLDHPLDVAVVGEAAGAERHLELPDLVRVARLDEELLAPLLGPRVETIEELVDLSVELRQTLVDRVEVEAVRVHAAADRELRDDVREEASRRREGAGGAGDEHAATPELLGDPGDRHAAGSAAADDDRRARIEALVDRDVLDRRDHVLVRDGEDGVGRAFEIEAERLGHARPHGLRGPVGVELEPAAQEVVGVDVAEHHRGVRDRRLDAAQPVAGRAGHRAGALRAHTQQARRVDPGDRAAARADRLDVDRREPRHVARPHPAEPGLARELDVAVADDADVEARAAHVADDRVPVFTGVEPSRDRSHRGPGVDGVDGPRHDVVDREDAAERRDDEQLAGESRLPEVVAHLAEMPLHERLQRRVDGRRRCPPVLADDRVQAMRQRVGDPGQLRLEQLSDPLLVLGVRRSTRGSRRRRPRPRARAGAGSPPAPGPRREARAPRPPRSPARGSRRSGAAGCTASGSRSGSRTDPASRPP